MFWPENTPTVMLRNIPPRCRSEQLLAEVIAKGFDGEFDFFYMPKVFHTGRNRGYAFINFVTTERAGNFAEVFRNSSLTRFSVKKNLDVIPAKRQGYEANVTRSTRGRVSRIIHPNFRPMVFADVRGIACTIFLAEVAADTADTLGTCQSWTVHLRELAKVQHMKKELERVSGIPTFRQQLSIGKGGAKVDDEHVLTADDLRERFMLCTRGGEICIEVRSIVSATPLYESVFPHAATIGDLRSELIWKGVLGVQNAPILFQAEILADSTPLGQAYAKQNENSNCCADSPPTLFLQMVNISVADWSVYEALRRVDVGREDALEIDLFMKMQKVYKLSHTKAERVRNSATAIKTILGERISLSCLELEGKLCRICDLITAESAID